MYILLSLNSNVSLIQLLIAKLEKGGKHMPPEEKDKIMQVHVPNTVELKPVCG